MTAYRYILVAATAAMFVLHLASTALLRRGVRGVTLLRYEAAYYVLLVAALAFPGFRHVLIPAVVLAALHLMAWAYSEIRQEAGVPGPRILRAVQVFDTAEAIVLAWIAVALI